jgi:hypothetical protein
VYILGVFFFISNELGLAISFIAIFVAPPKFPESSLVNISFVILKAHRCKKVGELFKYYKIIIQTDLDPQRNSVQALVTVERNRKWNLAAFQNTRVTYVGRPEESQKLTEELGLAMTIFYSYFINPVVYQ